MNEAVVYFKRPANLADGAAILAILSPSYRLLCARKLPSSYAGFQTCAMAAPASAYKDRQFLAVIGDEVRTGYRPGPPLIVMR